MKRLSVALTLVALVAACGGPKQQPGDRVHPIHGPSVTKPGVSISGKVNIGVAKNL